MSNLKLIRNQATRLLSVGGSEVATTLDKLDEFLSPDDLLVFNDSATVPASFRVKGERDLELRLAAFAGNSLRVLDEWWTVAFGAGDWRSATENRPPPRELIRGECLELSSSLKVIVIDVDEREPRLVKLKFQANDVIGAMYEAGVPIQYSYHREPLAIWDVQTKLAGLPLSVEPPSAALQFNWRMLLSLKTRAGFLTHGAGLSSTGTESLDRRLPLPEFYSIPDETIHALGETKRRGGRVIAVGTTTARAIESFIRTGVAEGITDLKLG
ncbi:MAG: S-adenosylmethionine:tRNA ribosyltransferase-isomerase, partial [Bdellovibrionota bacterium]